MHTHWSDKSSYARRMDVDGWTEAEDRETDEMYDRQGTCFDCGEPDSGYCRCLAAADEASQMDVQEDEMLASYRLEAWRGDDVRAARWRTRAARRAWCAYQRRFWLESLVRWWTAEAAKPGSAGSKRAAKRFRAAAAQSSQRRQ